MLRHGNENRSRRSKPDASDLLLETNSLANTITLLTYVAFLTILQNNRSCHQIVRLLDACVFLVKAQLTKVGCSNKMTDPLSCCTHPICKASIPSFIVVESCFSFSSGWQKSKLCCSHTEIELFLVALSIYRAEFIFCSFFYITVNCLYAFILKVQWQLFMYSVQC